MAAGLSAAIDRLGAIVAGSGSWTKASSPVLGAQFLEQLSTRLAAEPFDYRYWTEHLGRRIEHPVSGSLVDERHDIRIDLLRHWPGEWSAVDHVARIKTLEAQAKIVEHSLLNPLNWAYSSTGIVLVNMMPGQGPILVLPSVVWSIQLVVDLRVADASVIVP